MNSFNLVLGICVSALSLGAVACSEDSDGGKSDPLGDGGTGGRYAAGGGSSTGGRATGGGASTGGRATGGSGTGGGATGGGSGSGGEAGDSGAGGATGDSGTGGATGDSGTGGVGNPDAANNECVAYCTDYYAECENDATNEYTNQGDCVTTCAGFAHGAPGNNDDTFECRRSHLDYIVNDNQDPDLHCQHTGETPVGYCGG